jgi:hypothetical protein
MLLLTAAFALLIDALGLAAAGLRASIGLLFWWICQGMGVLAGLVPSLGWIDLMGIGLVWRALRVQFGTSATFSLGIAPAEPGRAMVTWAGLLPSLSFLVRLGAWLLVALCLVWLAARLFARFDPDRTPAAQPLPAPSAPRSAILERLVGGLKRAPQPVWVEVALALRLSRAWRWLAPVCLLWGIVAPLSWAKALLLFLPLSPVAPLAARERMGRTEPLILHLYGHARTYLGWKMAAGLLLASLPAVGLLVRLALVSPGEALSLAAGLLVTVAVLVALALLTGGPIAGLVVMGLWWYLTMVNRTVPALDYGGLTFADPAVRAPSLVLAAVLSGLAYLVHRHRTAHL